MRPCSPFAAAACAASLLSLAQGCGNIEQRRFESGSGGLAGRVVDLAGKPAAATVNAGGVSEVQTEKDGLFYFAAVPVGRVTVTARDREGRYGAAEAVVIGDRVNALGELVLGEALPEDSDPLPRERRLTSGPDISAAVLSASGRFVLWQERQKGAWRLGALGEDGALEDRGSVEHEGLLEIVDDAFTYAVEAAPSPGQRVLVRTSHADSSKQRSKPLATFRDIGCLGSLPASGALCWSDAEANMWLEFVSPSELFVWRSNEAEPEQLTANSPSTMDMLALSPDGRGAAFARKPFGAYESSVLVWVSLEGRSVREAPGDVLVALAFSPGSEIGALRRGTDASLVIEVRGVEEAFNSIRRIEIAKALDDAADPALGFDVATWRWVVSFAASAGDAQSRYFAVDAGLTASAELEQPPKGMTWLARNAKEALYETEVNDFTQIAFSRRAETVILTEIAADHRLIGFGPQGALGIFLVRDPGSGVSQLFSVKVEMP